jgi:hypothetical protein
VRPGTRGGRTGRAGIRRGRRCRTDALGLRYGLLRSFAFGRSGLAKRAKGRRQR